MHEELYDRDNRSDTKWGKTLIDDHSGYTTKKELVFLEAGGHASGRKPRDVSTQHNLTLIDLTYPLACSRVGYVVTFSLFPSSLSVLRHFYGYGDVKRNAI